MQAMDFKNGFIHELTMKANQNGVASFQLENALGTATHAFAGYLIGKGVRKAINKSLTKRGKARLFNLREYFTKKATDDIGLTTSELKKDEVSEETKVTGEPEQSAPKAATENGGIQ